MKTLHASVLFFSAALLLNHPCMSAPGQWEVTGSMVNARAQQTATLMPTGDVLVIGGISGNFLRSRKALSLTLALRRAPLAATPYSSTTPPPPMQRSYATEASSQA